MSPTLYHCGKIIVHAGDCMDVLRELPDNSIDAVCTDPPYHLTANKKGGSGIASINLKNPCGRSRIGTGNGSGGFMGKAWDGGDIAFTPELWAGVRRVLKPGGHMIAFGGTRTYHRMVCAIEDAGFEIRDQLAWVYGSGFPKSHDVSKGIDRAAGAERDIIGLNRFAGINGKANLNVYRKASRPPETAPATDAARQWQGWGTALKPAWEPICLARKPLSEPTVAANVLRWGTGAINIDGCRIEGIVQSGAGSTGFGAERDDGYEFGTGRQYKQGRWPANLIHDGSPEVLAGFPDAPGQQRATGPEFDRNASIYGKFSGVTPATPRGDSGSAARFFYTAKADADDRLGSKHPTVKPVDLMQWLVRLVCPKGGTVLDPFAGTGTTGAAAFIEGCRAVLIEREAEYLTDIERRMELLLSGPDERARKLAEADPHESLPLFSAR